MIPNLGAILADDEYVTDLLGTDPVRVYEFGEAPQKVAYPYAVWQLITGVPGNFIAGVPKSDRLLFQFDIYAKTGAACKSAAVAIRLALEPRGLWLRIGNTTRDTDTRSYRISMDISVFNRLEKPLIITGSYGPVTYGVAYVGGPLSVSGGFGSLRFSTDTDLRGLTMNPKTGVISGMTNEERIVTHELVVTVRDRRGNTATHTQPWSFNGSTG